MTIQKETRDLFTIFDDIMLERQANTAKSPVCVWINKDYFMVIERVRVLFK